MAKRSRGDSSSSVPDTQTPSAQSDSPLPESEPGRSAKFTQLDQEASTFGGPQVMQCSLPPHRETISFASYDDYEVHYAKSHVNRCTECGKNFPTGHFLSLHIEENHDPLIQARKEKGEKTYGCFVEGCERKCSAPHKRRRHLIDKHMFPRTYNFYIVNDGIDKRSSMLRSNHDRRRRVSTTQSPQHEGRVRRRAFSQVSNAGVEDPKKVAKAEEPQEEEESDSSDDSSDSESPRDARTKEIPVRGKLVLPVGRVKSVPNPAPEPGDEAVVALEKSMSALKFVPTSVTLNRRSKK